MKIFSSLCRLAALASAGFVGLLVDAPSSQAAPGGAAGGTGNAANVGTAGGGSIGGGVSVGAGFGGGRGANVGPAANVGAAPGQHLGSGINAGFNGGRPGSTGTYSLNSGVTGGRLNSTVGAPLARPNFNNLSRPTFGAGQVGSAPAAATSQGGVPALTRRFDGVATVPRVAGPRGGNPQPAYRSNLPVRPSNAWTDARSVRNAPAAWAGRAGPNRAYDPGQTYLQHGGRLTPGQHLYPGASDYNAFSRANNRAWHSRGDDGYRHNRHRDEFYNIGLYYPYIYTGLFPGYFGYGDNGGFPYYSGLGTTSYGDTLTGGTISNGAPDFTTTPNPYYDQNGNAPAATPAPAEDASLPPNQPAQVGPAGPSGGSAEARPEESGPDSLVEAVQDELAKRGYFAGKVDAMYGESTREAIRRFQTDQKLATTGRINEATLHALKLD